MANEKNLKRFGKEKPPSSREEAVKNGRKGGKKSAEVRAQAKTSREIVEMLDGLPVTDGDGEIMTRLVFNLQVYGGSRRLAAYLD